MIKSTSRRTSSSSNSSSRRAAPRKRSASVASPRRARELNKPPARTRARVRVTDDDREHTSERPAPVLGARELRELRAQAHGLSPLVQVGHGGVSSEVLTAVSRALQDHELIKVRLHEPEDKQGMAEALATGTRSALCGLVGHTVILYRPQPKQRPRRAPRDRSAS